MPRGRDKHEMPQESIDSILLAVSRREDIDHETLSHYFDRLDEEWTQGAREKVLHLLRSHDVSAHTAAILILSELATDFDLEELEDFVTDPTVSDMAKLALSPILKELGSEMADEGLVEYLNDPAGAMLRMQMNLLELVGQSEKGVESVLEDVASMPLERKMAFINWLGNSNDPRAAKLLIPLMENQAGKVVLAVLEALEQLGATAATQTIPALNYLVSTTSNRQVKQQARAVLGRLMMHVSPDIEMEGNVVALQHLHPYQARVSFIDGSGGQMVLLSWRRPDGRLKGVNVFIHDQWGVKDCYGIDDMELERWVELINEMQGQGFGSFHVSFEYGRALIIEHRALSKRLRHKLPIAYNVWRPLIEARPEEYEDAQHAEQAPPEEALPAVVAEPLTLDEKTRALVAKGADLYKLAEFASWMFDPVARLEPYINRYWSTHSAQELLFPPTTKRKRRGASEEQEKLQQEKQVQEDVVLNEAIDELIDEQWQTLYETRLRKQAALFAYAERKKEARLMNAVAAALHPASGIPAREQPFVRMLMKTSIEQGPLRMMVEALGSGSAGPLPIALFGDEPGE
jgi:hypothetical protein